MKSERFRGPSPAMTVAVIALIVALGGTSYAAFMVPKNSVGTRQLKNDAVTAKKIRNGSVTGAKLNLRGVVVPQAASARYASTAGSATTAVNAGSATNAGHAGNADSATNASNAAHATNADSATNASNAAHATNADSATNASNAAHATNADQLGGSAASAFRDRCPSGTTLAAADLCVTTTDVGTAGSGENTWNGALTDCAALGLRLPSPAEAFLLVSTTAANPAYWTDDFYQVSGTALALAFTHDSNTPAGRTNGVLTTADEPVRCVTTPANS